MGIECRKETHEKTVEWKKGNLHSNHQFAAMLSDLDTSVGMLMNRLEELNLNRKTLVLFTSDNGGIPKSSQAPLRGSKGMLYEGGIRVPLIARWTGVVKPGRTSDIPVTNVDFYPTFLDVAGADLPKNIQLDGERYVFPRHTDRR